jgi:effector-binding domain-containing protein
MEQSLILNNNQILISYSFLISANVSRKTIETWVHRGIVKPIREYGESYINFSEIPKRTKANLPSKETLIALQKQQETSSYNNYFKTELETAFYFNATSHREKYNTYKLTPEKILLCSRLHAVWEKLLSLQGSYGWLQAAYSAFNNLFPDKYKSYNSFANAVSKAKKSIESVSYDERLIKEKPQLYDERIYTWLAALVSHAKKIRYREIASTIAVMCKSNGIENSPTNLLEWVKKHGHRLLQGNVEIYTNRYGSQEGKKQMPFSKMIPAKNPLTQVQIDGFTVPVYYQNKNTSWAKLVLFAVVDSHSKKIIGYQISESEDRDTILKGIKDAVSKTNHLPFEIVSDNHSANKTDELKFFKEGLKNHGVEWTVTENPQQKKASLKEHLNN